MSTAPTLVSLYNLGMRVVGSYQIHWKRGEVFSGEKQLRMSRRQFKLLSLLVRAGGHSVARETLFQELWGDRFVEEGNLAQAVFLLRKLLGKLPDGREYIETLPGVGYRLGPGALSAKAQKRAGSRVADETLSAPAEAMKSEDQFRLLVESIEDYAIYRMDCAGRVVSWNKGAEKTKGYLRAEILGEHYSLFFVPEDLALQAPERALSEAATKGRHSGEGWRIRKNGERFWAGYVITAMRSDEGKLLGYAKVVRDLTERKRQEDALLRMEVLARRERDRMRAAAESSLDAFYLCDAVRDASGEVEDFVFTYLNKNVEQMVSIPRERLLGAKMCELLPVNREQGLFEAYKRVLSTGIPFVSEFAIRSEHVKSEWIRLQAVRVEEGVAITASDITERKRREEEVLYLAHHDPLTGLANRNLLRERMNRAVERIKRYGGEVGVCLIDLDGFKQINDEHGHGAGDEVLRIVAERLNKSLRATDSVLRLGGDEFLAILPDEQTEGRVMLCAQRILDEIHAPMFLGQTPVALTCSIGIALYGPGCAGVEELMARAYQAMYAAKHSGKNGLKLFREHYEA
jgi:diguanylate cyclase (GGDEF)-like protein/PAS domain S-box-containing protein